MSNFSIKIWITIWGAILAAVYFAFDHKYGKDKDFEKRNKSKTNIIDRNEVTVIYPYKKQAEEDYKILLTELQMAETLMSMDDEENAVKHFANAIVISSEPLMFVNSLKQTLPLSSFNKLIDVLSETYGNDFRKQCLSST
ncbi:hypothetical protein WA026_016975 [Henosepilachna vigintioctopunctata]|uniref:Uncharacterized protein n=1 Tax=Henosepilachna vigintioctopunctata TaxID=420089 RepID=A0AAW1U835_9CUCU